MDIQLKKEMIAINETLARENTQVLVQSDIIVPDVKSDMAKVLQIDSQVMTESVAALDGAADVSGKVSLTILYVPEGDTKPVCSICSAIPFTARVENKNISANSKCIVSAQMSNVEFSMLNSRKLSVKAVAELNTRCIRENNVELVCDVSSEIPVETHKDEFWIYNLVYAGHEKIGIRETLDFPAGKPSAATVLKADAKINNSEVRLVTGKVVIKGSVEICTLYVSEDNTIEYMEHEIPFTEVLDAEGVSEGCMCDLETEIGQVDFSLRADSDGDMRLLDINILADAGISVSQNTGMSAVDDCFCSEYELRCETVPLEADILAGTGKAQEALRASVSLPENSPEIVSVYNLIAKPYISGVEIGKNRAIVRGSVDCYVLYLSASPTMPISTQKMQPEFEIPVEIDGIDEGMDCDINIDIAHQSYNITMNGEIEVRLSVVIEAKAIKSVGMQLISNAYIDEEAPVDLRRGIVIYFVQKGDTLWKIAKKYRVPMDMLIKINRLENPDLLNVGQRLLIPNTVRA